MQQEKKYYSYFCDCIIAARILTFFKCHQRCKASISAWNNFNANFFNDCFDCLVVFLRAYKKIQIHYIQGPGRPKKPAPQSSAVQNFPRLSKVPNMRNMVCRLKNCLGTRNSCKVFTEKKSSLRNWEIVN